MTSPRVTPIVVATLLALAACGGAPEPDAAGEEREAAVVSTATLAAEARAARFEAGGLVEARTTASVSSRITAPVVDVLVAAGDRVRRGQALVRLDGRDLDAARQRARAGVTAAERSSAAADADRSGAQAALVLATATHDRVAALYARQSATSQELDVAVAALREAEARAAAAEARAGETSAAIEAARAAEAGSAVAVGFTVVTAPFDGIVTETLTDVGRLATPGVPLVSLEAAGSWRLVTRVDQARAALVRVGETVTVELDGGVAGGTGTEPVTLEGRIAEVGRTLDVSSRAFAVEIELPEHARLRTGGFARARFPAGSTDALLLPAAALVARGQLTTAFTVVDGRARMRVVSVVAAPDGALEILAGLHAGDVVVLAPPASLHDGDPVRTAGASRDAGGVR
ncbi:MAG: efflux RND transporter periplasmic adaptor subunit [Vicinamibacterales bacterium]